MKVEELMKTKVELPERWRFYVPKIETHLNEVIQNISNFEKELIRSLTRLRQVWNIRKPEQPDIGINRGGSFNPVCSHSRDA